MNGYDWSMFGLGIVTGIVIIVGGIFIAVKVRKRFERKRDAILEIVEDSGPFLITGLEVKWRLKQRGIRTSIGTMYSALSELEDLGLISSRLEDGGPERGGHGRKLYWRVHK